MLCVASLRFLPAVTSSAPGVSNAEHIGVGRKGKVWGLDGWAVGGRALWLPPQVPASGWRGIPRFHGWKPVRTSVWGRPPWQPGPSFLGEKAPGKGLGAQVPTVSWASETAAGSFQRRVRETAQLTNVLHSPLLTPPSPPRSQVAPPFSLSQKLDLVNAGISRVFALPLIIPSVDWKDSASLYFQVRPLSPPAGVPRAGHCLLRPLLSPQLPGPPRPISPFQSRPHLSPQGGARAPTLRPSVIQAPTSAVA